MARVLLLNTQYYIQLVAFNNLLGDNIALSCWWVKDEK